MLKFPDLKVPEWNQLLHVEKVIIVVFLHCYLEFLIPLKVVKVTIYDNTLCRIFF